MLIRKDRKPRRPTHNSRWAAAVFWSDRGFDSLIERRPDSTCKNQKGTAGKETGPARPNKKGRARMQQRRSSAGRPSGTDGSDFSYRMVVDSRYQKVAEGRYRLRSLILIQTAVLSVAALPLFLSVLKGKAVDALSASSLAVGIFSLMVGELGRRRSRASLLRVYVIASSVSVVVSVACVAKSNLKLEDMKNAQNWEARKFELLEGSRVFLGLMLQMIIIKTAISLIRNMSPPKRAS